MYLLKPLELQLDVKITGGVHTGCLRVQTGVKSNIKSIQDLKGKKIGVPVHLGSPPYLFASRVLADNGIDPRPAKNEITWLTFAQDVLGKAVEDGRVDAIATSDPIGTILEGMGLVRTIADQAVDQPYCEEYCCVAVVSGKLGRENPAAAAKVTRAILKAAKWVEENPTAAARLSVEKKYTSATVELNAQALAKLRYLRRNQVPAEHRSSREGHGQSGLAFSCHRSGNARQTRMARFGRRKRSVDQRSPRGESARRRATGDTRSRGVCVTLGRSLSLLCS